MSVLWLLLGQTPGETLHTNQRALRVPINFQDSRRNELRELLLFASWDQGKTYQQVATVLPDKSEFLFNAPNDGTCWLKVAVVNRAGTQEPENIQQGPPDQKIVIDTIKPLVRTFTAQRQGDEVAVAWEILEDSFDAKGFRLEYQLKDNPSAFWTAVDAPAGLTGQKRFRPTNPASLQVRLIAKDLAGNQSVGSADVAGTNPVNVASFNGNSTISNPSTVVTAASAPQIPAPAVGLGTGSTPIVPPPLPPDANVAKPAPPPTGNPWTPAANPGAIEPQERLVATSNGQGSVPPPGMPGSNNIMPAGGVPKALPTLQYVNHPEVMLEYELAKVGPSGVGSVDLWWTRNDGQSWELYAVDPEVKGTTQSGRHQRTVELPGDGVYGFVLVVKSRAGLGKAPPRAGDAPEIRVEVDTVSPIAQLYSPGPDAQRPGALTLKWAAKDNNLATNPITLEWSERRDGPWQPIAVNVPNTGKHSWQLPDRLPVQVYMRLRARDLAGNESVALTPEPQLVDLSEPEGRLLNVSVIPRRP